MQQAYETTTTKSNPTDHARQSSYRDGPGYSGLVHTLPPNPRISKRRQDKPNWAPSLWWAWTLLLLIVPVVLLINGCVG